MCSIHDNVNNQLFPYGFLLKTSYKHFDNKKIPLFLYLLDLSHLLPLENFKITLHDGKSFITSKHRPQLMAESLTNCNTSALTPFTLNAYGVYIVINHSVELKEKMTTMDYCFYVSVIKSVPMVSCASRHIIIFDIM